MSNYDSETDTATPVSSVISVPISSPQLVHTEDIDKTVNLSGPEGSVKISLSPINSKNDKE